VQGFAKISSHQRRQTKIVRDQPNMVVVVPLFGRLQRHAEFAFSRSPFTLCYQAKTARVATFRAHRRIRFGQLDRSIQVLESCIIVAPAPRDRRQGMQRLSFAFVVSFCS